MGTRLPLTPHSRNLRRRRDVREDFSRLAEYQGLLDRSQQGRRPNPRLESKASRCIEVTPLSIHTIWNRNSYFFPLIFF